MNNRGWDDFIARHQKLLIGLQYPPAVGSGWAQILERLCSKLAGIDGIRVHDIKQKFGGLRFYYEPPPGDRRTRELIESYVRAAQDEAWTTCEQCGAPGRTLQKANSWFKTLCGDCAGRDGYDNRVTWTVVDYA